MSDMDDRALHISEPQIEGGGTADSAAPFPSIIAWTCKVEGGGVISVTCPPWCVESHEGDQDIHLANLTHGSADVALEIRVGADEPPIPTLRAAIWHCPYEEDVEGREPRAPFIAFEPTDDILIEMDAEALAEAITRIRRHVDQLQQMHARLEALRNRPESSELVPNCGQGD